MRSSPLRSDGLEYLLRGTSHTRVDETQPVFSLDEVDLASPYSFYPVDALDDLHEGLLSS
jgi:hypothetical protein